MRFFLIKIKIFNTPLDKKKYAKNIYWVYGIVLKKNSPISLNTLMKKLKQYGIETRNFFWPLHQQPILKKMGFFKKHTLLCQSKPTRSGGVFWGKWISVITAAIARETECFRLYFPEHKRW